MLKLVLFLGLLALSNASGQPRVICYQGTVVYDVGRTMVYASINTTVEECADGQQCAIFDFTNTDAWNRTSFIQSGFCLTGTELSCSALDEVEEVGMVTDCSFTICATDRCNKFMTNLCNNGTLVYETSGDLILSRIDAGFAACSVGQMCGMFRFYNYNMTFNYLSYVESGFCVDSGVTHNCSQLASFPGVGQISNCTFESGEGASTPYFTKQVPLNRGFRCDQGVFASTLDMSNIVFTANVTDEPCQQNEACAMWRWQNTDDMGSQSYVESGICINTLFARKLTCQQLSMYPGVNNVTDCTVEVCSGDFCTEFTHLQAPSVCPGRPPIGDIQVLPGCTMTQILDKSFMCLEEIGGALPFQDPQNCSEIVDRTVNCMSQVLQDCIRFKYDGVTPCPSVLDVIPNFDIAPILQEVRRYAMNVTSVQSLRMLLEALTNGTADLSVFDMVCAGPEQLNMILNMLRNLTANLTIGLGSPVCRDDRILDDLIQWGIEQFEEMIAATSHRDVCLSFDKIKARMEDAIRNRCYGLDRIGSLLFPVIGEYFSDVVQRAIDITKYYLLDLALPGCEDVPYPTHFVCNQGPVAYSLTKRTVPIFDQSNSTVCPPYYTCGMYRWDNTDPRGFQTYSEFGFCRAPDFNYTCDLLRQDTVNVANVANCTVEGCKTGQRCLPFSKDRCPDTPDNDVAVLPRCSLRNSLERGFGCLGSFVGGYPYSDQDQCRSEVDDVVRCVRNTLLFCLSGDCETVLDFIPGLRKIYTEVRNAAYTIDSLADALRLVGLDDATIDMAYRGVCGDSAIRDMIREFLNNLELPEEGLIFDNPVCDDRILLDLTTWGLEAARAIINAENHQDFCVAFSTLRDRIVDAWNSRCNIDGLFAFLNSVAPPQIRGRIQTAVQIVFEFFTELEIPNCDMNSAGLLDCSPFYEGSSSCAMRRAWLCDYVNWKLEFLTVWLRELNDYSSRNMLLDAVNPIGCIYYDSSDLCMEELQRVCRVGADGCRFCYCKDHQYRNLARVMDIYRQDWKTWRLAFDRYRRLTQQNQDTCSYN